MQYDRIMGYVESGKQEGAKVLSGGKRHGKEGFFIEPVSGSRLKMVIGANHRPSLET